ncbi:hypothetical protein GCM10020256_49220 [Streptomyces thermocoprophilus]
MRMSTHRRKISGRNKAIGGLVAAAVVGGGALVLTGTAQAAGVGAAYTRTSSWETGYTAQYVVTNNTGQAGKDWTLEFDLPAGSKLGSLWNAESSVSGQHVTVKPPKWDTDGLTPGESVTVGFVVNGTGDPTGCRIDGASCSTDGGATPEPTGRPTQQPTPHGDHSADRHPDQDRHAHGHRHPPRRRPRRAAAPPPPPGSRRTSTPPCTRRSTCSPPPTRPA